VDWVAIQALDHQVQIIKQVKNKRNILPLRLFLDENNCVFVWGKYFILSFYETRYD
jgi:hypothetical protein